MPKCPKCAVQLCRIEIQGIPVHTCPECKGELVEDARLRALEERGDPAWTEEQKNAFCELADQSNNLDHLICPRCGRQMDKFLFRNYANLQVDHCDHCKFHWFDSGEIEKMQILRQDELASRTPEDWDRIEKRARSLAAMDFRKSAVKHGHPDGGDVRFSAVAGMLDGMPLQRYGAADPTADTSLDAIDRDADRMAEGLPAESGGLLPLTPLLRQSAFVIALLIIIAIIATAAYVLLMR